MLNICKFQEYLGNSRKLNPQNKEFKFCHLQNFIKEKPCQPKIFDVLFNGARSSVFLLRKSIKINKPLISSAS